MRSCLCPMAYEDVTLSKPPVAWIEGLRSANPLARIGVQSLRIPPDCGVMPEHIEEFLRWIAELIPSDASFDMPLCLETLERVAETEVCWQRARYKLYPLYLESLEIVPRLPAAPDEGPPGLAMESPRIWKICSTVLRPGTEYYRDYRDSWARLVAKLCSEGGAEGGLSFNMLVVRGAALRQSDIDVRPLVLHALAADGAPCDRGNPSAQAAIANAFWQTFWATGALRTERGRTFPVAFLPIDRSWPGEFIGLWRSRWVSLRRRLYGRTSLLAYMCEALTKAKALWFDTLQLRFVVDKSFTPERFGLSWSDFALALYELDRTAFVDAYTGTNAELFSAWRQREQSGPAAQPWSENEARANCENPQHYQVDPQLAGSRIVLIPRVVPYAGCAYLSEVVNETESLRRSGKIRQLDGEIIAATNSTFFLNFPEEYATLHSAMNDPVSTLVEDGYVHQIRTLRRAAFAMSEDGRGFVTTDIGLELRCEALLFEGESVAATYFHRADRPFRENRVGPLNFGCVVVGNSIVEVFEDEAAEIPANGWVVGDSEAFGGEIDPCYAASVKFVDLATGMPIALRHALAVGPLLVADGQIVPLGGTKEEFKPIVVTREATFDQGAELARTVLPPALSEAPQRGVPPTRFPYDWDRTRAPRTAIGLRADGSVILVVVDGRARLEHSVGATLAELAHLMRNLGCVWAMNMDGGGSSVMFVNDPAARRAKLAPDLREGVVNLPSDLGGVERLLPVPLVIVKRQK